MFTLNPASIPALPGSSGLLPLRSNCRVFRGIVGSAQAVKALKKRTLQRNVATWAAGRLPLKDAFSAA
jgi:hypothetical protein